MKYFHTTPTAAPIIGIVTALIMAVGGYLWLVYSEKKLSAKGDVYTRTWNKWHQESDPNKKDEKFQTGYCLLYRCYVVVVLLNYREIGSYICSEIGSNW